MANLTPEEQLHIQFDGKPWYHSVGRDQYNRLVVYTNYMCHETLHDVPDRVDGIQVLTHFAASKLATREQFVETPRKMLSPSAFLEAAHTAAEAGYDVGVGQMLDDLNLEELDSSELEIDINELCRDLDRLEKKCGANILMDIFFEVHDGKNAVTNLASRYPEVKEGLQRLYDAYGFDVIYNELEG